MKFLFPLFIIYSLSYPCLAQNSLKKVKDIPSKEVTHLMVDRLGNFFTVTRSGEVKKYDPNGKVLARLKDKKIKITLLEPWYHPAVFIYDQKKQAIYSFDRNLENRKEGIVEPSVAVEPYLVCPRGDNRLLILDAGDYSIKVVNPLTNTLQSEFSLGEELVASQPEFVYLREYQNLIFLLDRKSGIWILNNIGKLVNRIEATGLNNFNFFGEEVYYLKGNQLQFFDLYTEETRSINLSNNYRFALTTDERIITIDQKNLISIFELPSSLIEDK